MLTIPCPNPKCAEVYHAEEAHLGREFRCTGCGQIVLIARPNDAPTRTAASPSRSFVRDDAPRSACGYKTRAWMWGGVGAVLCVLILTALYAYTQAHRIEPVDLSGVLQEALPSQVVADRLRPSILVLEMEDEKGRVVGRGTGFFVRDDVFVTNIHLLGGAYKGRGRFIGSERTFEITAKQLVGGDSARDLVLFRTPNLKAPPLPLGESGAVRQGDAVYVMGNPLGLVGTFSQGIVSALRPPDGVPQEIQISAPISRGSSGSPVVDENGRVIGVVRATVREGQNLNLVVPVSYLRDALENSEQRPPAAPLQTAAGTPPSQQAPPGPKRPRNGQVLHRRTGWEGPHELLIQNGTSDDGAVALVSSVDPPIVYVTIYVRAGNKAAIGQIAHGTYRVRYQLGEAWNGRRFSDQKESEEFVDHLPFILSDGQIQNWEVSLKRDATGNARSAAVPDADLMPK